MIRVNHGHALEHRIANPFRAAEDIVRLRGKGGTHTPTGYQTKIHDNSLRFPKIHANNGDNYDVPHHGLQAAA